MSGGGGGGERTTRREGEGGSARPAGGRLTEEEKAARLSRRGAGRVAPSEARDFPEDETRVETTDASIVRLAVSVVVRRSAKT